MRVDMYHIDFIVGLYKGVNLKTHIQLYNHNHVK